MTERGVRPAITGRLLCGLRMHLFVHRCTFLRGVRACMCVCLFELVLLNACTSSGLCIHNYVVSDRKNNIDNKKHVFQLITKESNRE